MPNETLKRIQELKHERKLWQNELRYHQERIFKCDQNISRLTSWIGKLIGK